MSLVISITDGLMLMISFASLIVAIIAVTLKK
ncbi:putative holin-like toxin [Peribacillus sp. NPDC060186]